MERLIFTPVDISGRMGCLCNRHLNDLLTLALETKRNTFILEVFQGEVSLDVGNRLRGKREKILLWVLDRYQWS